MFYKLLLVFFILLFSSFISLSQSFSLSPYSKFGIGDLTTTSFQPGIGMGYTSISQRSNRYINDANPASISAIDTLSFLSEFSLVGRNHSIKNAYSSTSTTNTDISFFAMAFPIKKGWGTSIGLNPYSNVGYKISDYENIDTLAMSTTYKGDGGFNEVFLNNGFKLFNLNKIKKVNENIQRINIQNLSIGIRTSYIFGSLDRYSTAIFNDEKYVFDLYKTERILVSDFTYKLGLQYEISEQEVKSGFRTNKYKFCIGLTFDNQNNLNAKQTSLITKYLTLNGYITKDTIENAVNKKGTIQTPMFIGTGISFTSNDKLTLALDIKMQQWSKVKFWGENPNLNNAIFIGTGIQYIPDPYKFYDYWKIVNYRLGTYYNQTYLNINNTNINEIGITFGLGIPITKTNKGEVTTVRQKLPPMINLSFTYGSRGTTENNLLKENFLQFSIGLSLYDIWFIKRKYN